MKKISKFALLYALLRIPPSWFLILLATFVLAPVFIAQKISQEIEVLSPYIHQQIELYGGSNGANSSGVR